MAGCRRTQLQLLACLSTQVGVSQECHVNLWHDCAEGGSTGHALHAQQACPDAGEHGPAMQLLQLEAQARSCIPTDPMQGADSVTTNPAILNVAQLKSACRFVGVTMSGQHQHVCHPACASC